MVRFLILCLLLLATPVLAQNNYQPPPPGQLGLIATGTNQASALVLPAALNVFRSVPPGTGARPPSVPTSVTAINSDPTNALLLYPPSGDQITGSATNAPISILPGQQATLTWFGSALDPMPRQWVLTLSPTGGNASNTLVTATGGTAARTAAAIAADTFNVLSFSGADPSGVRTSDNSVPINAAAAATRNGTVGNVYLPAGTYHVKNQINIGSATQSQCLIGDGDATIIDVDSDFSATATGVVVVATGNATTTQPCVVGIKFLFHQPDDIVTTTTAGQTAGNNTIALTSNAGLVNGMVVVDTTATAAILSPVYGSSATPTTMTFSGLTATLSANVASPGVGSGDTIHFASPRAQFKTLAAGCTTTTGGSGCQYPWAIYNNGAVNMFIDRLLFVGAWDGVYQRGSTFHFGVVEGEAFDIGLDIDNCHNFPQIDTYEFWNFGTNAAAQTALSSVYYDGATIAANLGAMDGVAIHSLQSWTGIVNVTTAFTWGTISSLQMDGSNALLNVLGTSASGFLQIGEMYSTLAANSFAGALVVNSNAAFATTIDSYYLGSSYAGGHAVTLTQGKLDINGGNLIRSGGGTNSFIAQAAGSLKINNAHFSGNGNATNGQYVAQAGGALAMRGNSVDTPFTAGWVAVLATDNALNSISGNNFNGWTFVVPGTLGDYNLNGPAGPLNTTGAATIGTLSTTTSTIKGALNISQATTDLMTVSTSKATISNPLLVTAPSLNTGTNTSIHLGVAESAQQDVVIAFNYIGAADPTNNLSFQMFGGTKGFSMSGAGAITLPAVTTGINADFVCMAAGNVLTLQTSACTISSLRFKDVLGELTPSQMVADVMALHPVAFKMKTPAEPNADPNYDRPQIGMTAENVAAVDPRLAVYEDDMTTPKSYRQEGMIAALVVTAQTHEAEIKYHRIALSVAFFWLLALTYFVAKRGRGQPNEK